MELLVAVATGLRDHPTLTIAAAFGCPFELAIADTIGVGVPAQVRALADVAASAAAQVPLRWHFHNTRNTGYANVVTALDLGASALDASPGGIGGCPFAPAATGSIATEDQLIPALEGAVEHQVPGQLSRAGGFPAR